MGSPALDQAKVDAALQNNRAPNFAGENPRWSSARWTAATDDDLSVAGAPLHGTTRDSIA